MGGREEQLPILTAVEMRGDEGVDPVPALTAVGDGAADRDLVDGSKRGPEDWEWEFFLGEWADQGAVLQLRCHVGVDIMRGDVGRPEITSCILGCGRRHEGEIPAVGEGGDDLLGVEVATQGEAPRLDGEGRSGERDPERIHVGRRTW